MWRYGLRSRKIALAVIVVFPAVAQIRLPEPRPVPIGVRPSATAELNKKRNELLKLRSGLLDRIASHRTECSAVVAGSAADQRCIGMRGDLLRDAGTYNAALASYDADLDAAIATARQPGSQILNDQISGSTPALRPAPIPKKPQMIGSLGTCRGALFRIDSDGHKVPIRSGEHLFLGEHIVTGPDGRLQAILLDETVFTIGPNGDMVLDEFVYDPERSVGKIAWKMTKGSFRWVTGKIKTKDPADMKVKLPVGTIGIRGTDFEVYIAPDSSGHITVFKGEVQLTKRDNEIVVIQKGETVTFGASGQTRTTRGRS